MSIGGPVSFASGFLESFARNQQRARQQAIANDRAQIAFALKQLKERKQIENENRKDEAAIARHRALMNKATIEARTAQSEIDSIHAEMERVRSAPGTPFKDAALEGRLAEAHERLDDARNDLQESQGRLQDLIADRDARVRSAIPSKTDGFLGWGQRDLTTAERKAAIVKGETADTAENRDFSKLARETQRETGKETDLERRERAKAGGYEKSIEAGQSQQGAINEEKRDTRLFPLRERETAARGRYDVQNAAIEAAADEIARRQSDISGRDIPAIPAMPGPGGPGAATGKGGGTGGPLGALTGKGGGMGAPSQGMGAPGAFQGVPGAMQGSGPTVAQALAPVVGKLLQMPAPQAIATVRSVLGGAPPRSFAGKGGFGAGTLGQPGARSPRTSAPRQGGGGTTHFHFHQAPSGSRGQSGPMQGQDVQAPMPPPRSSSRPSAPPGGLSSTPGPGAAGSPSGASSTLESAYQPTKRAMDEPAMEWYHSHPVVPESEAGKYAPQGSQEAPQSSGASKMNQGVPMIYSPDQLKGMKPGSLFRAPGGKLKMIPAGSN